MFQALLENVLVSVWGGSGGRLTDKHLRDTRKALATIRAIYRFKGERGTPQPSSINYGFKKNRAGYLAAYGERHAYLTFLHLKHVQAKQEGVVPQPSGRKRELVVTSLGAGACLEIYGLCLFYLENHQQPLTLRLNSIEKERMWVSNRHTVFDRVLKESFPKLEVDPIDIDGDLSQDAIPMFSQYYDRLAATDILLIYNVMNEIPTTYARPVWRNIKFLLNIFQKKMLILLMEPSAARAEPRIHWLKQQLSQETHLVETSKEEVFSFDSNPVLIETGDAEDSLNYRLFGKTIDGSRLTLEKTVQRNHMACVKLPNSPLKLEEVAEQISRLEVKRGRKGEFLQRRVQASGQRTFTDIDRSW